MDPKTLLPALVLAAAPVDGGDWPAVLEKHRYFSKIAYAVSLDHAGLELVHQTPPRPDPNHLDRIVDFYGPWCRALGRVFDATFAEPLGIEPLGDAALAPLVTEGDYVNYLRRLTSPAMHFWGSYAHYEPGLGLVVFPDGSRGAGAPHERRTPALHELVRGHVLAERDSEQPAPPSSWQAEGLAAYLTACRGREASALERRFVEPHTLQEVVHVWTTDELRPIYHFTLPDLLAGHGDFVRAWTRMDAAAKARGASVNPRRAWDVYCGQATLWFHFLMDAEDGQWREPFLDYLAAWFLGSGSIEDFARAFAGTDLVELQKRYHAHWLRERRTGWPQAELDAFVEFLAAGARTEAVAEVDAAVDAEEQLDALLFAPDDLRAHHGAALAMARRGDVERAAARLERAIELAGDHALAARARRDAARLRGLGRMRERVLRDWIDSGERVSLELPGGKLTTTIAALVDGVVTFGESRRGPASLPLAELPPYAVARRMSRDQTAAESGWLRAYAYALEGDERWRRVLDVETQDQEMLEADAGEWLGGAVAHGEAVLAVEAVAADRELEAPGEAAAKVEAIAALLAEFGAVDVVDERRPALRELAARALRASIDERPASEVLRGEVEPLDGGRIRVTYSFEDAAELGDFELVAGYPAVRFDALHPLLMERHEPFAVRGGALRGSGDATWRLRHRFTGDVRAEADLAWGDVPPGGMDAVFTTLAVCDDGAEGFVACENVGTLMVHDARRGTLAFQRGRTGALERTYRVAVGVEGGQARTFVDGTRVHGAPFEGEPDGHVFFMTHSDSELSLRSLTVEGTLHADALIEAGVRAELERLGL